MNILEKKFKVARIPDIDKAIKKRRKITDQEKFDAQQEKNRDHANDCRDEKSDQAIGEWMSERRDEINILGRR